MEGEIIYSFPVLRAIEAGYVKRLRAKMLRPTELRYVDRSDGQERLIDADEVRELGETNSEFRRGIVMSDETLASIVDQSIGELRRLREEAREPRLKIIASPSTMALHGNYEAFRARGIGAAYVHSREGQITTAFQQLEIPARRNRAGPQLGKGFDLPYLAVAMVGSIFPSEPVRPLWVA